MDPQFVVNCALESRKTGRKCLFVIEKTHTKAITQRKI